MPGSSKVAPSQHRTLFILIVVLYVSSVINIAMDWNTVNSAFIKNASTSDATLSFMYNPPVYTSLVPEVFKCLNIVIADGILVRVPPSHQHNI
jgi:hypothetical protein